MLKALHDAVRLRMDKDHNGKWQIVASFPGPRDMTVRFDVPDEIVHRIARFMFGAQAGFAREKRIQGNGLSG